VKKNGTKRLWHSVAVEVLVVVIAIVISGARVEVVAVDLRIISIQS
jgi:hypothetical protein